MFILSLNQNWFQEEFRARGHKVVTVGLSEHLDVCLPAPLIHIDTIVKEFLSGEWPDVVLILDNSAPICVVGLEERAVPTLFYAIDTHHHFELHADLACVFDRTVLAQKDYIPPLVERSGQTVSWMPLWASHFVEPIEEKDYGAVFVGTLNPRLNPDRVAFFDALQKRTKILCKSGTWWEIFPKAEMVINQTVKSDLNFRVFEAMMSGALLLTERTTNGLFDLFEDGKHFVSYEKGNVEEAAEKITFYLQNRDEARRIARAGRDCILRNHLPEHRAVVLEAMLAELQHRVSARGRFFSWMSNCVALSNRLAALDTLLSKQALVQALKSAEQAIGCQEPLNDHYVFRLVYACVSFDGVHGGRHGLTLLEHALAVYPNTTLIALGVIRGCLNRGERERAFAIAREIRPDKPESLFDSAEEVICALLKTDADEERAGSPLL